MKVQKQRLEIVAEQDGEYHWDGRKPFSGPEDAVAWAREVGHRPGTG